jgi:glycosyltransferase involved in cell wall biosynthesis
MNQQPLFYFRPVITTTMDLTMLNFTRPGNTPLPVFKVKLLAYRFLFWYSNKKSRAIITISNYVKQDLAQHYPFTKGKTTTTYCASEPPLPGRAVKPMAVAATAKFLLYVGTAFPHKNLELLVRAMPALRAKRPGLSLVLVGKKEQYYERLDEFIAQQQAADYVTTTGWVPDEQLKWLYQHCQAYVFPSLSEGFGLPPLEAMVHGAPVVASDATCIPEVCGPAAEYFDASQVAEAVRAVSKVLDDATLRQKLITAGHAQAKKYSWQTMAAQTLALYQQTVDR